ncbi:hypothetical protein ALC57_13170 [Trachymyrmex cornetzi]|uniref:Uncharacterized protein n=1 Tax=Trachymyrmex cornetzi TaxID=471704 RepID=A0A151IZY6_9HYME|nr:hypothetical protein ALC57_13170 [Trachymyrmex cornetzi]
MLFSTTYGLNNSHTNTIHVGLQITNEGLFKPLVKLSGNNADGIYFDADSWKQFQDNMSYMNEYLTSDNRTKTNSVVLKNISINFTTTYGAKSILLAYKDEEEELRSTENISGNLRKEEVAFDSTPPSKKRGTYAVATVMQKTTFLGLQNVVKCVDAHLKQLESLTDNVNKCAQYLIREIELKLPVSYINQEIIKLILRGNYDEIERNVRTQINDLTFLDIYFSIIFLELISLRGIMKFLI